LIVTLALFGCGASQAGYANSVDGALIAHHPPGLQFSMGTDWCEQYGEGNALLDCDSQHNRIDLDGHDGQTSVWYVVGAFHDSLTWRGAEFGFGAYDPAIYEFIAWGPCYPSNGLEIDGVGWPGPNTGTAFVATDGLWKGRFSPVYYFAGYAYAEGLIPLGPDPAQDMACMGVVFEPSEAEAPKWLHGSCGRPFAQAVLQAEALGGMGIFRDGTFACPDEVGFDFDALIELHLANLEERAWQIKNPNKPGITPARSLAYKALHLRRLRLRAEDHTWRPSRLNTLEADPDLTLMCTCDDTKPDPQIVVRASGSASPTIEVTIFTAGQVTVMLYDANGSRLETLHDCPLDPGTHPIIWPEGYPAEAPLPEGAYMVELVLDGEIVERQSLVVLHGDPRTRRRDRSVPAANPE